MNAGQASPWSPRQRRWLQALGHGVLRAGGDAAEVEAAPDPDPRDLSQSLPATGVQVSPATGVPDRSVAPMSAGASDATPAPVAATATPTGRRPHRGAPAPATADTTAAPGSAGARAGGMRRPVAMPDRLQLALLRASGLDPADPATRTVMEQWPVAQLRGDAAAKRRFWPQLRALRKPSS